MTIVRVLVCALVLQSSAVLAQSYPSKPVRILSGQPPGGATDLFARVIAQKLNETWKQPVIIEHRAGASGAIAAELTVRAPPDGHTLLFATAGMIVINPHLTKLVYDPVVDLAPVAFLTHTCMLLTVHPSVPATSVKELIALAKAQPGKLNHGSGGNGTPSHLGAELLKMMTGTSMTHVPFKGAGPSILALVSGQIDLSFSSLAAALQQAKAGRLRALAVSTAKRSPVVPDIPTLAEAGVPGYAVSSWYAFFGPSALPKDTINRIHADIGRIGQQPEVRERLFGEGAEPEVLALERFAEFIRADSARWGKVIRAAKIGAS